MLTPPGRRVIPVAMSRAFFLSLGQLGDPAVLRVFALSLAVTLGVFAVAGFATWYAMQALLAHWIGWGATGLATAFAAVATALALWLLFRAVAVAVIGLFADDVVAAVERRHYPDALATAKAVPFARGLAMGLRSAVRVILVNLVLLPLYVVLLATGVGTAAVFLIVNGWLLGRDLGDMVAARHLDAAGMAAWRRETAGRRFLMGLADAALFLIPVVNLAAPVMGAAMATHLFHTRRR